MSSIIGPRLAGTTEPGAGIYSKWQMPPPSSI
jgi:hypothetical protein